MIGRKRLCDAVGVRSGLLMTAVSALSLCGTVTVLSGGVWDAVSHLSEEPELFWTIQHVVVYAGVGMSSAAGAVGYAAYRIAGLPRFSTGVRVLLVGTVLLITAGVADSVSHDVFGIDGLVSLSHQPLELGLVLVSLAGLIILRGVGGHRGAARRCMVVLSAACVVAAACWLGFNLMLIAGGTLMCIPVYEAFSSGCAIL